MKLNRNDLCHCGSGKKYKKCCLSKNDEQRTLASQQIKKPKQVLPKQGVVKDDVIVATLTGEYAQPVRLCYEVYDKQALHNQIFKNIKCMSYDSTKSRWVWLFDHEAKHLVFEKKYSDIPKHLHPIVIGSFFSNNDNEMYLDVRSHERAEQAIVFFDRYIPREIAKVTDALVLNRLITQNENELLNDFDTFFNKVTFVDKAKIFDDMIANSKDKTEILNFLLRAAFDNSISEMIPDAERIRINYYEDGIDQFCLMLDTRRRVALNKHAGKETTQRDIMNLFSNMKVSS